MAADGDSADFLRDKDDEFLESVVLSTTPYDRRFPNTNQTKNCYQNFIDWKICARINDGVDGVDGDVVKNNDSGSDNNSNNNSKNSKINNKDPCLAFKRATLDLCPTSWVNRWEDQIEQGIFPHPLVNNTNIINSNNNNTNNK